MVLKGPSSGICFCNWSNPCTSEDTHREEVSSSKKEEDDLHEQDEDIFDNEDDTITVSG